MRFIDLFAGLGGFHVALEKLGHDCVFASEKKISLANLYEENFNIKVDRDITKIEVEAIPNFDILCAGFPCQPFSKAGSQKGLEDEKNGSLFHKIIEILDYHKPKYFILENVRNVEKHNNSNTWKYMEEQLQILGYNVDKRILSPHFFGIPQHRERLFIIGSKDKLDDFEWPKQTKKNSSIHPFLDVNPDNAILLEEEKSKVIDIWQEFIASIPKEANLPSFPVWSMEFGATYPFEENIPFRYLTEELQKYKGNFGKSLMGMNREEIFKNLPSYVQKNQQDSNGNEVEFPNWKKHYIRSNRAFYDKHKTELKPIIKKIKKLSISSWQKFEWNVQGGERDLSKYLIQFRGSGVRIKKTDFFPSLVTVSTQIPILGWERRYITPLEGARLQSLENIILPENTGTSFSALGNAVNAHIVKLIVSNLIKS